MDDDYFLKPEVSNVKINEVCYILITPDDAMTMCMDLIGRFPKQLSSGNEYIFTGYYYDSNCIIKNYKGATNAKAWEKLHIIFKKVGTK